MLGCFTGCQTASMAPSVVKALVTIVLTLGLAPAPISIRRVLVGFCGEEGCYEIVNGGGTP